MSYECQVCGTDFPDEEALYAADNGPYCPECGSLEVEYTEYEDE